MAFFQLYLLMRIFDSIGGLPLAAAIYGSLLATSQRSASTPSSQSKLHRRRVGRVEMRPVGNRRPANRQRRFDPSTLRHSSPSTAKG